MANSIQLPVTLYIENLQNVVKDMRAQLSGLKVDSSGYKKLLNVINDIEKRIQGVQVQSSRPFVDMKQFNDMEKEVKRIEDDFTKLGIEAGKIKFSDIQLDASQKAKLQEFDAAIKATNDELKNLKETAKEAFLSSDAGQLWKENHKEAATQSFAQITKAIVLEVEKQKGALKEAQQAYTDYQNLISANRKLGSFLGKNQNHQLSEANMGKDMYDQIFGKRGDKTVFKANGRNLLTDWLVDNFQLDRSVVEKLVADSAEKVQAAFAEINGSVEKSLKQEKVRLGDSAKAAKDQSGNGKTYTADIAEKQASLQAVEAAKNQSIATNQSMKQSEEELSATIERQNAAREEYKQTILQQAQAYLQMQGPAEQAADSLQKVTQVAEQGKARLASLDKATGKLQGVSNFINRYVGVYAIVRKVTQAIRDAFSNIKDLDKVITNIAVVTNMSQQDLWGKIGEYTSMAQQYGVATKDVYTVSQLFYQQGLQTSQVMSLTTETLKMAKIAGMDYSAATNAMTVAIRAFNINMQEAQQVTDTYSALAAKFAVSSAEIANAMEKTASSAANVGMSLQSTSAFMSVMIQTTRESAQNIGSALKSIISRYGEMKASPSSLINVDGEEVAFNKVDTALQSIGISIKDASGQFRDFDEVIMELAEKWNTLDNNTQRYIATVMAGNRQQSRFIALVSNYDELNRAMQTANDSENASIVQVGKTMDSLETKAQQLKNAFSQIYLDLHVEDGLKDIYSWLTRIVQTIGKLGMAKGVLPTLANLIGFGTGMKNLINLGKDKLNSIKSQWTLKTDEAEKEIKRIRDEAEKPINTTLNVDTTQMQHALEMKALDAQNAVISSLNGISGAVPQAQAEKILQEAQKNGTLHTDHAGVIGQLGIKKEDTANYEAIDRFLQELDTATTMVQKLAGVVEQDAQAEGEKTSKVQESGQTDSDTAHIRRTAAEEETNSHRSLSQRIADSVRSLFSHKSAVDRDTQSLNNHAGKNSGDSGDTGGLLGFLNNHKAGIMKGLSITSSIARMAGTGIALNGASIQDKSTESYERSKVMTGIGNGLSGFGTGMSLGMMTGNPIIGALGGLAGFVINGLASIIDGATMTLKEKLTLQKQELETLQNDSLKKQAKAIDLSSSLDNIKQLQKAMYQSTDDMQAYKEAMNNLASEYPQLVSAYDEQGNAIIDLNNAERTLAEIRLEGAEAARQAIIKEGELHIGYAEALQGALTAAESAKSEETHYVYTESNAKFQAGTTTATQTEYQIKDKEGNYYSIPYMEYAYNPDVVSQGNNVINPEQNRYVNYGKTLEYYANAMGYENLSQIPISKLAEIVKGLMGAEDAKIQLPGLSHSYGEGILAGWAGEREKKFNESVEGNTNVGLAVPKELWEDYYNDYLLPIIEHREGAKEVTNSIYKDLSELDAVVNEYSSLFGGKTNARQLIGIENQDTELNGIQMQQIRNIINNTIKQNELKLKSIRLQSNYGLGGEALKRNILTLPNINPDDLSSLSNKTIYSQLFTYMANASIKENTDYQDALAYYSAEGKEQEYNQYMSNLFNEHFITWYNQLTTADKKLLESLDFTEYQNADEIITKIGKDKFDKDNKTALENQFIESNKSNRDRILKTIYNYDGEQQLWTLNDDLEGLKQFSSTKYNIDYSTGIATPDEINKAMDIAYRISTSRMISKYSDYFSSQLLKINDLAEQGLTDAAQAQLNALDILSYQVSENSGKVQRELFGIVTSIDFSDYDSIIKAQKDLEVYGKEHKDVENLDALIENLKSAATGILFNINTLAQSITSRITNASKNIESIISTNASGLSFDKALEEFNSLEAFSDKIKNFSDAFTFDATLGKYVYSADGLAEAIKQQEDNLEDNVRQLAGTMDTYTNIVQERKDVVINKDANSAKEFTQSMQLDKISKDPAVREAYQALGEKFYDKYKEVGLSLENWYKFLSDELDDITDQFNLAEIVRQEYEANKKNDYFKAIDWSAILLNTDFDGTNTVLRNEFAKEMKMLNATDQELIEAYFETTYENLDARNAAKEAFYKTVDEGKISKYQAALGELLNYQTNNYLSAATKQVSATLGINISNIQNSAGNAIHAASQFLATLANEIGKGSYTLEQYNQDAKSILDKTLSKRSQGKSLLDFASGDINADTLTSLAQTLGQKLTDIVDVETGAFTNTVFSENLTYDATTNTYKISTSLEDFVQALNEFYGNTIDTSSAEYIKILKSWNDTQIELHRKTEKAIADEINALGSAKGGDWLNVTNLAKALESKIRVETDGVRRYEINPLKDLNNALISYGGYIEDSILKIYENANLAGIAVSLKNSLADTGLNMTAEIDSILDTIDSIFNKYLQSIQNGISGGLTNAGRTELVKQASQYGVSGLDFIQTADGLKLTTDSIYKLYSSIRKIDQFAAKKLLKNIKEMNSQYKDVTDVLKAYADAEKYKHENEKEALSDLLAEYFSNPESFNFMRDRSTTQDEIAKEIYTSSYKAAVAFKNARSTKTMDFDEFNSIFSQLAVYDSDKYQDIYRKRKDYLIYDKNGNPVIDLERLQKEFNFTLTQAEESFSKYTNERAAKAQNYEEDYWRAADASTEVSKLLSQQDTKGAGILNQEEIANIVKDSKQLASIIKQMPDGENLYNKLVGKQISDEEAKKWSTILKQLGDSEFTFENFADQLGEVFGGEYVFDIDTNGKLKIRIISTEYVLSNGKTLTGDAAKEWQEAISKTTSNNINENDNGYATAVYELGKYDVTFRVNLETGAKEYSLTDENNNTYTSDSEEGIRQALRDQSKKVEAEVKEAVEQSKPETEKKRSYIINGQYEVIYTTEAVRTKIIDGAGGNEEGRQEIQDQIDKYYEDLRNKMQGTLTNATLRIDGTYDLEFSDGVKVNVSDWELFEITGSEESELHKQIQEFINNKEGENSTKITADYSGVTSAIAAATKALDAFENKIWTATIKGKYEAPDETPEFKKPGQKTNTNDKQDNWTVSEYDKAYGNVALAKGKTLMGELGSELVVSNGRYYLVGQNGAEMVDLPDDAIVFNHLQTRSLLNNGHSARGKAVINERKAAGMAHAKQNADMSSKLLSNILGGSGVKRIFQQAASQIVKETTQQNNNSNVNLFNQLFGNKSNNNTSTVLGTYTQAAQVISGAFQQLLKDNSDTDRPTVQEGIIAMTKHEHEVSPDASAMDIINELGYEETNAMLGEIIDYTADLPKNQQLLQDLVESVDAAEKSARESAEEQTKAVEDVTKTVSGDIKDIVKVNDELLHTGYHRSEGLSASTATGTGSNSVQNGKYKYKNRGTSAYYGWTYEDAQAALKRGGGGGSGEEDQKTLEEHAKQIETVINNLLSEGFEVIDLSLTTYEKLNEEVKSSMQEYIKDPKASYREFVENYADAANLSVSKTNELYFQAWQKDMENPGLSQEIREAARGLKVFASGRIAATAEDWTALFGEYTSVVDLQREGIIEWNETLQEYVVTSIEALQTKNTNLDIKALKDILEDSRKAVLKTLADDLSKAVSGGITHEEFNTLNAYIEQSGLTKISEEYLENTAHGLLISYERLTELYNEAIEKNLDPETLKSIKDLQKTRSGEAGKAVSDIISGAFNGWDDYALDSGMRDRIAAAAEKGKAEMVRVVADSYEGAIDPTQYIKTFIEAWQKDLRVDKSTALDSIVMTQSELRASTDEMATMFTKEQFDKLQMAGAIIFDEQGRSVVDLSKLKDLLPEYYDTLMVDLNRGTKTVIEQQEEGLKEDNADIIDNLNRQVRLTSGAGKDAVSDLTWITNNTFGIARDKLEDFANTFGISINEILEQATWSEELQKYIVKDKTLLNKINWDSIENIPDIIADGINSFIKELVNTIKNGISGSLTNADITNIKGTLAQFGFDNVNLDFTETVDGLKLSEKSAISLYTILQSIDALQARLVFKDLNESLKKTNDNYRSLETISKHIVELKEEIAKLEAVHDDTKINQYKEELELAKKIMEVRATEEDSSMNFMDQELPGALKNPLNYASSITKAMKAFREALTPEDKNAQAGFMDYKDLYNMAQWMNGLASDINVINVAGHQLNGTIESFDSLMTDAAGALKATDSGEVKVALEDIGTNLQTGFEEAAVGANTGLKTFAQAQVKVIDGLIKFFETIVAMEELGEIDIDKNDILDLTEVFIDPENGLYTEGMKKYAEDIVKATETNDELNAALSDFKINNISLLQILKDAADGVNETGIEASALTKAYNALYQLALSNDYDLDHIAQSLQDALAGLNTSGLTFQYGDQEFTMLAGEVIIHTTDELGDVYSFKGKTYRSMAEVFASYNADALEQLSSMSWMAQNENNSFTVDLHQDGQFNLIVDATTGYISDGTNTYATMDDFWNAKMYEYNKSASSEEQVSTVIEYRAKMQVVPEISAADGLSSDQIALLKAAGISTGEKLEEEWGDTEESHMAFAIKYGFQLTSDGEDALFDEEGLDKLNELLADESKTMYITATLSNDSNENLSALINSTEGSELTVPLSADITPASEAVQALRDDISNNPATLTVNANTSPADAKAKETKSTIDNLSSTMTVEFDNNSVVGEIQEIIDKLDEIQDKTVTATITTEVSGGASAAGTIGNAMAGGTKETLMGELGPELYVSNGQYHLAGENGAEFVKLPNDAIVFNHIQTRHLMETGSAGRGKPVTNEYAAVAMARGTTGPAAASAKAALATLKQLRAMWESLANMTVQELAGKAADTKHGGPWLAQIERWYDLLQKIARLEKQINYEEALRNKLQSDRIPNGEEYYKSQVRTLDNLKEQAQANKELAESQEAYFELRRKELNERNAPLAKFYQFDEYGQLKYAPGALNKLSAIFETNEYGAPKMSAAEQYSTLVGYGLEEYMRYNSSGELIERDENDLDAFYKNSVQALYDRMEAERTEMQSLYDSKEEKKIDYLNTITEANKLLQEIIDNQLELEQKVLTAIEEQRQEAIDKLTKERQALSNSSEKYISGLQDALSKERELYNKQRDTDELTKLQRKLAILERSGGSAAEISSLQEQISEKQQEAYFTAQEDAINAAKEASDLQLEKLQTQIDIATEELEYEKANGLLWSEVADKMSLSSDALVAFITGNTATFKANSTTGKREELRTLQNSVDQWAAYRDNTNSDTLDVQKVMNNGFESVAGTLSEEALSSIASISQWQSAVQAKLEQTASNIATANQNLSDSLTGIASAITNNDGSITIDTVDVDVHVDQIANDKDIQTLVKKAGSATNLEKYMNSAYNRSSRKNSIGG